MDSTGEPVLPPFTLSGVLPPYHPDVGPTANAAGRSPYRVDPEVLVARYATSPERKLLLRNLFAYRQTLRDLGMTGYQWIDGSFVEDVEQNRGRPPADIDLITHVFRPIQHSDAVAWDEFLDQNWGEIQPQGYGLHCFLLDLMNPPPVVVSQAVYWFGLFSHQRDTALWKGIVQIDLSADDTAALALLEVDNAD